MDQGKYLMHYEEVVDGDSVQVHETFLKDIWWDGALPAPIKMCFATYQLKPATDPAGTGGLRQLPSWVQEEIVAAELGKFVEYRVKKSWLPLHYHHARVTFQPVEAADDGKQTGALKQTRIIWEIRYTPAFGTYYVLIRPMFVFMIKWSFLPRLKRICHRNASTA